MTGQPILNYRDLDAWNVAMELCVMAYEVARRLPMSEQYGLSAQMRRSAVSIPSNIAEGHAFGTATRCVFHLRVAVGSIGELDTQFELAVRLKFVAETALPRARAALARTRQLVCGLLRAKVAQVPRTAGRTFAFVLVLLTGPLLLSALR